MTAAAPPVAGALAAVLEANRDACNARVAEVRHDHPALDTDHFGRALADLVAPAVEAVAADRATADAVPAVGMALFELALDLVAGRRLAGPVHRAWAALLPAAAPALARAPREVAGSITNAVVTLDQAPGARPDQWTALVADALATGTLTDPAALLAAGQVAAWRAGMAGYRPTALDLAAALPAAARAVLVGPAAGAVDALRADPWLDPATGGRRAGAVRVGAFVGLGGAFTRPPRLAVGGGPDQVLATDGAAWYLVVADASGHAIAPVPPPADAVAAVAAAALDPANPPDGVDLPAPTSWVRVGAATAVTSAVSHAVTFLVAP